MRNIVTWKASLQERHPEQPDLVDLQMTIIEDFQTFLSANGGRTVEEAIGFDANTYAVVLRQTEQDVGDTLYYLFRYAKYLGNEDLASELVLFFDAWNVMTRMSDLTKEHHAAAWENVFGDVDLPQVGATLDEMSIFTREVDRRMQAELALADYQYIMCKNAHAWDPAWDGDWQEQFRASGSLDAFITLLNESFISELVSCRDKGELFWSQIVDDQVMAHMKANPLYTRLGHTIRVQKIPYLTRRYLAAEDTRMKRFYACHCPWIRNSILQEEGAVSRHFCNCSLGHAKRPFDVAFGRAVTGRVIETVMDEDGLVCLFEIDIPTEHYM